MIKTYSIIGLGKLGASMAAAIASRGFEVIGVDVNPRTIEAINTGHAPVQETNLEETIAANRQRIRATSDYRDAVLNSELTFVIVPTPSDERGAFSLKYAAATFREIGKALAEKDTYHVVVLTSTVLPGSTRFGLLPILEKESGKVCGHDFGLCYSPEFIALGSILHDFLHPDFTLVGQYAERDGAILEECYSQILPNKPPCQRMTLENAEIAKVSLNTFVTTKITFANMLADICERIPGGDVDVVTNAIGLDTRIGRRYLTGAIGYGGPCFPRDNVALGFIARELGTQATLAETTNLINRSLTHKIAARLRTVITDQSTVAILGLSYKPYSHVLDESQSVSLARMLIKDGVQVVGYDPLSREMSRNELPEQLDVLDSVGACLRKADVVVIATPDPAFRTLTAADFRGALRVTVMDCWRTLTHALSDKPNINYIPVGRAAENTFEATLKELWSNAA